MTKKKQKPQKKDKPESKPKPRPNKELRKRWKELEDAGVTPRF